MTLFALEDVVTQCKKQCCKAIIVTSSFELETEAESFGLLEALGSQLIDSGRCMMWPHGASSSVCSD